MVLDTDKYYAAITGDVINSSAFDDRHRDLLHDAFLDVGSELNEYFPGQLVGKVSIFRGDSIQFLLHDPAMALRATLFVRSALKASLAKHKTDMRLAIGIGQVSFFPESNQGGADGEAYRLSGAALDNLAPKETLALYITTNWSTEQQRQAVQTIAVLLGFQAESWTSKQALALKWALLNKTQEEISQLWPESVTRQAVAKSLEGAGQFAVEHALQYFENLSFKE